jgi:hypothetical protein
MVGPLRIQKAAASTSHLSGRLKGRKHHDISTQITPAIARPTRQTVPLEPPLVLQLPWHSVQPYRRHRYAASALLRLRLCCHSSGRMLGSLPSNQHSSGMLGHKLQALAARTACSAECDPGGPRHRCVLAAGQLRGRVAAGTLLAGACRAVLRDPLVLLPAQAAHHHCIIMTHPCPDAGGGGSLVASGQQLGTG